MACTTEPETRTARKQHRCSWCWQLINPTEQYKHYRFFDGGDAGTCKMHPECFGEMQRIASEEGGYFEWVPGMERPAAQPKGGTP